MFPKRMPGKYNPLSIVKLAGTYAVTSTTPLLAAKVSGTDRRIGRCILLEMKNATRGSYRWRKRDDTKSQLVIYSG